MRAELLRSVLASRIIDGSKVRYRSSAVATVVPVRKEHGTERISCS